jgi:D-glycero-D-manno-heptose 1,7-bisphosphate phosphatase
MKYIVFDRDGTLVKHLPYVSDPRLIELLPGVKESLTYLKSKGFQLFLHTNQSGVARGYFEIADVESCNRRMIELLELGEDVFEDVCIATDFPPGKITMRKPSPSFGLALIKKYNIDIANLYYIGDSLVDIETGKNLNCTSLGVNTGEFDLESILESRTDLDAKVYSNLTELIQSNF